MAFPVDSGHPQQSGLLIPEVWSPLLNVKFYEFQVLEAIANTNWEGEIKAYGDKVHIRQRPDININEYEKGMDLAVQTPSVANVDLDIDRGLYWNFLVEDVDRAQADIAFLEEWTEDAAESQSEETNEIVLGESYTNVDPDNQGATAGRRTEYYNLGTLGSPLELTPENVIPVIGQVGSVLTEAKVPRSKRWGVISPWVTQLIYESPYNKALIQGGDQDLLRKGHVGSINGFDLYESNQLAMVEENDDLVTHLLFGHISALTFASQFVNSEVVTAERKFGRYARGLNVFGFENVKPDAMAVVRATLGSTP